MLKSNILQVGKRHKSLNNNLKIFEKINWQMKPSFIKSSRACVLIRWNQERVGQQVCGSDNGEFLPFIFFNIPHLVG